MKIGIVNDMPIIAEALRRTVTQLAGHEVVWVSHNGHSALENCQTVKPELILLDLIMPGIDGVEVTRQIMLHTPCPILLVTSSVDTNMGLVFQALGQGALDAVDTPNLGGPNAEQSAAILIKKIKQIKQIIQHDQTLNQITPSIRSKVTSSSNLIVIGASAGGPAALNAILSRLPSELNAAILIVQHIDANFVNNLAKWLALASRLPLRLAREGDYPQGGNVLLAGAEGHLVMTGDKHLHYAQEPRESAYRPSVNTLFESICKHWCGNLIGVVLTGMGVDGAQGLKAIRDKGHHTIVQDKVSSAIYGMPKAAVEIGAATDILPLKDIAQKLVNLTTKQETHGANIRS